MINEIYKKWKHTRLLEGIDDENKAIETALLLDNQHRFNTQDLTMPDEFKRVTIPLARRVFPSLQCGAEARFEENINYRATLNVEYKLDENICLNKFNSYNLVEEAHKVALVAEKLTDAIDAFVFGLQSEADTFFVQGFGINENKIVLFYDLE